MDPTSLAVSATPTMTASLREGVAGQGERPVFPGRHIPYGPMPRHKLDVYLPRNGNVQATIIFYYGGGWVSGARWYYRIFGRAMAARGYAVVVPDYRLFPQVQFPTFNHDAALAFKWVVDNMKHWGGSATRLFVMGHSAGAHISTTLALDPRYLDIHGLSSSNIRGVIGLAGPYTLNPLKWRGVKDIFAPSASFPDAARPIKLVRPGAPPMLLLHGERDRVVGAQSSTRLAEALTEVGNSAKAVIFPNIGHFEIFACFLPGWRWRSPGLKEVEAFLQGLLGPAG